MIRTFPAAQNSTSPNICAAGSFLRRPQSADSSAATAD
jgi:hypothetical protein